MRGTRFEVGPQDLTGLGITSGAGGVVVVVCVWIVTVGTGPIGWNDVSPAKRFAEDRGRNSGRLQS